MELRAVADPKLIRDKTLVNTKVKMSALKGMSQPGRTVANHVLKGSPLSRAKAYSWRELVATKVNSPKKNIIVMKTDIAVAPLVDWTAL